MKRERGAIPEGMLSPIPVFGADGTFVRYVDEDHVLENVHHFRLIKGRRGHLKRVILKSRDIPATSLSKTGTVFKQVLDDGRSIWALRGVIGSAS